MCRDNDGDGRVDVAGLVTWSSNANADICTDPTDRTQFFPVQTSKCQLDPDLNIPIIVEPPPSVVVDKVALPENLPAPGGQYVCEFTGDVTGSTGYSETDTVIAQFVDDEGEA